MALSFVCWQGSWSFEWQRINWSTHPAIVSTQMAPKVCTSITPMFSSTKSSVRSWPWNIEGDRTPTYISQDWNLPSSVSYIVVMFWTRVRLQFRNLLNRCTPGATREKCTQIDRQLFSSHRTLREDSKCNRFPHLLGVQKGISLVECFFLSNEEDWLYNRWRNSLITVWKADGGNYWMRELPYCNPDFRWRAVRCDYRFGTGMILSIEGMGLVIPM